MALDSSVVATIVIRAEDLAGTTLARVGQQARMTGLAVSEGSAVAGESARTSATHVRTLALGIGTLATAAAGFSVYEAVHFDEALRLIANQTGMTAKQLDNARQLLLRLGSEGPIGLTSLEAGLQAVYKGGYSGADAAHVLTTAWQGAVGTGSDLATIVQGLTSYMYLFHIPAAQAGDAMDALLRAAQLSKEPFADFISNMNKAATIGHAAHMSLTETAAALAVLTRTMGPSAMQGFSLIVQRSMLEPTKKVQAAIDALGPSVSTAFAQFRAGSGNLLPILQALSNAGAGPGQLGAIFGGVRGGSAIIGLVQQLQEYKDTLNGVNTSAGTTRNAVGKAMDDMGVKLKTLMDQFRVLGVTIGEALIGPLSTLMTDAMPYIRAVEQWTRQHKQWAAAIVGVGLAIGGLALVIGPVTTLVTGLGAALELILTPEGAVVVAIAALVGGLIILYNRCEPVRRALQDAAHMLQGAFLGGIHQVGQALGPLGTAIFGVSQHTGKANDGWRIMSHIFLEVLPKAIQGISILLSGLITLIAGLVTGVIQLATDVVKVVKAVAWTVGQVVGTIHWMVDDLSKLISGLLDKVAGILGALSNIPFIGGKFGGLRDEVLNLKAALDGTATSSSMLHDALGKMVGGARDVAGSETHRETAADVIHRTIVSHLLSPLVSMGGGGGLGGDGGSTGNALGRAQHVSTIMSVTDLWTTLMKNATDRLTAAQDKYSLDLVRHTGNLNDDRAAIILATHAVNKLAEAQARAASISSNVGASHAAAGAALGRAQDVSSIMTFTQTWTAMMKASADKLTEAQDKYAVNLVHHTGSLNNDTQAILRAARVSNSLAEAQARAALITNTVFDKTLYTMQLREQARANLIDSAFGMVAYRIALKAGDLVGAFDALQKAIQGRLTRAQDAYALAVYDGNTHLAGLVRNLDAAAAQSVRFAAGMAEAQAITASATDGMQGLSYLIEKNATANLRMFMHNFDATGGGGSAQRRHSEMMGELRQIHHHVRRTADDQAAALHGHGAKRDHSSAAASATSRTS